MMSESEFSFNFVDINSKMDGGGIFSRWMSSNSATSTPVKAALTKTTATPTKTKTMVTPTKTKLIRPSKPTLNSPKKLNISKPVSSVRSSKVNSPDKTALTKQNSPSVENVTKSKATMTKGVIKHKPAKKNVIVIKQNHPINNVHSSGDTSPKKPTQSWFGSIINSFSFNKPTAAKQSPQNNINLEHDVNKETEEDLGNDHTEEDLGNDHIEETEHELSNEENVETEHKLPNVEGLKGEHNNYHTIKSIVKEINQEKSSHGKKRFVNEEYGNREFDVERLSNRGLYEGEYYDRMRYDDMMKMRYDRRMEYDYRPSHKTSNCSCCKCKCRCENECQQNCCDCCSCRSQHGGNMLDVTLFKMLIDKCTELLEQLNNQINLVTKNIKRCLPKIKSAYPNINHKQLEITDTQINIPIDFLNEPPILTNEYMIKVLNNLKQILLDKNTILQNLENKYSQIKKMLEDLKRDHMPVPEFKPISIKKTMEYLLNQELTDNEKGNFIGYLLGYEHYIHPTLSMDEQLKQCGTTSQEFKDGFMDAYNNGIESATSKDSNYYNGFRALIRD